MGLLCGHCPLLPAEPGPGCLWSPSLVLLTSDLSSLNVSEPTLMQSVSSHRCPAPSSPSPFSLTTASACQPEGSHCSFFPVHTADIMDLAINSATSICSLFPVTAALLVACLPRQCSWLDPHDLNNCCPFSNLLFLFKNPGMSPSTPATSVQIKRAVRASKSSSAWPVKVRNRHWLDYIWLEAISLLLSDLRTVFCPIKDLMLQSLCNLSLLVAAAGCNFCGCDHVMLAKSGLVKKRGEQFVLDFCTLRIKPGILYKATLYSAFTVLRSGVLPTSLNTCTVWKVE